MCVAACVCVCVGRRCACVRVCVCACGRGVCVRGPQARPSPYCLVKSTCFFCLFESMCLYDPQYALTLRRRYMYVSIYAAALGQVPDSTLDAKYKEDFKSGLALALAHPTDTQHRSIMQVSNACRNMCSLSLALTLSLFLFSACVSYVLKYTLTSAALQALRTLYRGVKAG